jgi:REP element-mobilizing transposase RayT
MPRLARIDFPGAVHHVIGRGIERRRIFLGPPDYEAFLSRLGAVLKETETACYAWALMPNHIHLLLRPGKTPLPSVMRRVLTGYAGEFNRKHRRHGHLFQNRYKSILCQEDRYLLELVRYIHLNPVRAGLVPGVESLAQYPYCGHGALVGKRRNEWQDTEYILGLFSGVRSEARRRYLRMVKEGEKQGRRPELTGGGLRRSLMGWEQKESRASRMASDERILGDGEFVLEALRTAEERLTRQTALRRKGYDLRRLLGIVAARLSVRDKDILSKGQDRRLVRARSLFSYWSVQDLGETGAAVARFLGITPAAVCYAVRRGEQIANKEGLRLEEGDL